MVFKQKLFSLYQFVSFGLIVPEVTEVTRSGCSRRVKIECQCCSRILRANPKKDRS